MSTPRETKAYLHEKEIPLLFECLMTGLLYHRPKDHLNYLQNCIEKIRKDGLDHLKWDLFLKSKNPKTPLPPISRESSSAMKFEDSTLTPSSSRKEKLPDILPDPHAAVTKKPLNIQPSASIILGIGAPGSDRTAFCRTLAEAYPNAVHICIGEELRRRVHSIDNSSNKARQQWKMAESLISLGDMVPQALVLDVLIDCFQQHPQATIFILDGYPRNKLQYEDLLAHDVVIKMAFLIDCFEDNLRHKLLEESRSNALQGVDATSIARRLNQFKRDTLPLCRELDDAHLLNVIEGEKSHHEILEDLFGLIDSRLGIAHKNVPRPPSTPKPSSGRGRNHVVGKRNSEESISLDQLAGPPVKEIVIPDIRVPDADRKPGLPNCPIVFVMGGPGSGRSEQVARLCQRYAQFGFVSINASEIARGKKLDPTNPEQSWSTMANLVVQGELQPEDISVDELKNALMEHSNASCILLEGYPRTSEQVEAFNEHIGRTDMVILLDCEEFYLSSRLLKRAKEDARVDDNMSAIGRKIRFFKEHTLPVVRYYDEAGKLVVILGDRDSDEVFFDFVSLVDLTFFGQKNNEDRDQELAATKIQAHVRGFQTRRRMTEQKQAWTQEAGSLDDLKNAKVVFVLGGPGSGKGTQCAQLVNRYGFSHLSSGDLLRDAVASGSEKGKELEAIMQRGELVPLEAVLDLMKQEMLKTIHEGKGFLIDGYPRELEQGIRFENEICPCQCVVAFDVSEEVMKQRLLKRGETSGRVDDNEETILKRLRTFNDCTKPVIDYYRKKGKAFHFDASGTVEEIFAEVCEKIDGLNTFPVLIQEELIVAETAKICGKDGVQPLRDSNVLFILGGPGSGKGTQCAKLVEKYGFCHLSSGDLLRNEVQSGSEKGEYLAEIMKRGELVALDDVLALMKNAMRKTSNKNFLIDGYPRELEQGLRFESEICQCKCVIVFEVSEEVMKERLLRRGETSGRADDNMDTILQRLRTFNESTQPVIDHYEREGKVVKIDASATIEEIFEQVCAAVDNLALETAAE